MDVEIKVRNHTDQGAQYTWITSSSEASIYLYPEGSSLYPGAHIYFPRAGVYVIYCAVENDCAVNPLNTWTYAQVGSSKTTYSSAYPNPVSDILNIKLKSEELSTISNTSNIKTKNENYDIRLYDNQGYLIR